MSRRILLADDSVTIQKVIDLTFSEKGFQVTSASDGSAAVELLTTFEPDLVITDVHMPGASGFEVCRRTKELYPRVPVMLLVGTFEPFEEAEAAAVGADVFVKKPFDDQELLRLAGDLLARSAPAAPAAAPPIADVFEELDPVSFAPPEASVPELAAVESPVLPAYPEIEEEVDLDAWDKLEIAAEVSEDSAVEPVWGNFDDALAAVSEENPEREPFGFEMPAAEPEPWFSTAPVEATAAAVEPPPIAVEAHSTTETVLFDIPALRPTPPAPPVAEPAPPPPAQAAAAAGEGFSLSEADVERIARRVAELISEKTVREIAWEIIPDVTELVVRDRIKELEAEAEAAAV